MADATDPNVDDTAQAEQIAQISPELEDAGIDAEDYEWGGDGSDLHEPVRAHVEAALVPTDESYTAPLDQLLHLGDPRQLNSDGEALYESLGFTQEHVPGLVRMARDRRLNTASSESREVWAPCHALRVLSLLDIRQHVGELLPLFDLDDDWVGEEAPDIISTAGGDASPSLQPCMQDRTRWVYARERAMRATVEIGKQSLELRTQAIGILHRLLEDWAENTPRLNGFILASLLDLDAVEALPTIRAAFEQNAIDETIAGDWSDILEDLGQIPDPDDPLIVQSRAHKKITRQKEFPWMEALPVLPVASLKEALPVLSAAASSVSSKKKPSSQKSKRKMASASRKANRKKK